MSRRMLPSDELRERRLRRNVQGRMSRFMNVATWVLAVVALANLTFVLVRAFIGPRDNSGRARGPGIAMPR